MTMAMMRDEVQRLRCVMRGETPPPPATPISQPPPSSQPSGFRNLREEMLDELNRLKRALQGEIAQDHRVTTQEPVIIQEEQQVPQAEPPATEHADTPTNGIVFRTLRDEMLGELRRLQRIMNSAPREEPATKLSPEEKVIYDRFMKLFARCPVCGSSNHSTYLDDFYFRPEKEKIGLRDSLIRIISKTDNFDHVFSQTKLTIGIPCCNCFKKIFSKVLLKIFLVIHNGAPLRVVFRSKFNDCNMFVERFSQTLSLVHYYKLLSSKAVNDEIHTFASNDLNFFLLGDEQTCYVALVEGPSDSPEKAKIERLLRAAKQRFEEEFYPVLNPPPDVHVSGEPVYNMLAGLVRSTGINT